MKKVILAAALFATIHTPVATQAGQRDALLTKDGWDLGGQTATYHYEEPDFAKLTGERIGVVGAYAGTDASHFYSRIDGRISYGSLIYEGSGTQDNNPDWIAEVRAVVGKDYLVSDNVALSPYVGLGYRYLFADGRGYTSTGAIGYRRYSRYFYVPVGLTLRIRAGDQWVIAPTVEYDAFIGGTQVTKLSDTGLGYADASNKQDDGYGYRVYLMAEHGPWSFGPWLQYWNIKDSDIVPIGFGLGALEPANWTREYGLEFRYRF